ncbi:hypothetical protein ACET3X_005608 [Alternaria dauci]|uniref:NmrA-like domain-containing protein n=1 Tax=Alternaria dauci TaxID=48095 RepID=A0ABR3ULZ5_9PLEO
MSKIITVFGATGNQGGSVIKQLLKDPELSQGFKVRGITRDTSKPVAQALAKAGVEMVVADLNSKDSLQAAIKGSHTVFLVTNYWESASSDTEITQGKNVADVSKDAGVGRLTHVPHFDSKADVEQYIRDSGEPATFYLPGYFMSNLETMIRPGQDGVLTWALPVGRDARFPLIDIKSDTGKFVKSIIKNRQSVLGARIFGAQDYYTPIQILDQLAKVTGKKTSFLQVDENTYKSFLPEFMAEELLQNHLFIENPGYYGGERLEKSHEILDEKLVGLKEFLEKSSFVMA